MEIRLPEQTTENFQQEEYAKEAEVRFDKKTVQESNRRYKSWSKEKIQDLKKEMKSILTKLADMKDRPIEDQEVQSIVREYHQYMENYYHVTREIFLGLAELYTIDSAFAEYFEKIRAGLTEFLAQAMQHYCNTEFKELTTHS